MEKRVYGVLLLASLAVVSYVSVQAGIIQAIIPQVVPTANKIGNSTKFQLGSGTVTSGNCPQYDAGGNLVDSGTTNCGGGGAAAFSALTGGTNTAAAMVVGAGASLATTSTGMLFANGVRTYTVATLPGSPSAGAQAYVTDGASTSDCVTGGGAVKVLCGYSGSAWSAESGGASSAFLSGTTDPGVALVPTIVQAQAQSFGVGGGSSQTYAYISSVTSGNVSVVSAQCQNAAVSSVTDTLGTTYTLAASEPGGNAGSVYTGTLGSSGADTVTVNGTGGCANLSIALQEVHGSNGVVDVSTKTTANTGPPAITTTVASDLLVLSTLVANCNSSFTATAPTVSDAVQGSGNSVGVAHLNTSAASTYTPNFTNTGTACGQASFTLALEATPVLSPGVPGSFYVNTTTGVLWGPKSSGGAWSKSGMSFVSTTGANGQFVLAGTAPTVGTCGTSPSVASGSTDTAGTINVGSGTVTACALNFGTAFTATPSCVASDNSTLSTGDISAVSTTSVTFSFSASVGAGQIYYHCF